MIPLIITIIILLVLVGVSIRILTSKNGITNQENNAVVIPTGFEIAKDSGIDITEGVVIEEKENKYV